jgi:hypothetical protein
METQISPGPEAKNPEKENAEFQKIILESKQNIANESVIQNPNKKGPGRPRKNPLPAPVAPMPAAEITPAPDISIFIKEPLIVLSKIPAIKYRTPELALTSDEAQACADAINGIVQAFIPDLASMSPKTAAIIGAAAVFGSIGFQKYAILKEKTDAKPDVEVLPEIKLNPEAAKQSPGLTPAPVMKNPDIEAGEYFKSMKV